MPERIFNVCGQKVIVSHDLDFYNTTRMNITEVAEEIAEEYGKQYDSYGNIEDVINKGFDYGLMLIADMVDDVVKEVLIKFKVYDIDVKRFFEEYYEKKYFVWDKYFNGVKNVYLSIEHEQQKLDVHRTQRLERIARNKDGTTSLIADVLVGAFNVGAKALSEVDEKTLKKSLYKYPETKKVLTDGIKKSIFNLHYAMLDALKINSETFRDFHVECLEYKADKKAEAMRNNFLKMPKEEVRNIFPQFLLRTPYDVELYKILFSIFGDQDGGLEKIAKYFGVEVPFIKESKDALAEKLFAEIGDGFKKTEQAALEAKEKFSLALKSNGLTENQSAKKLLAEIDSVINGFDAKTRTVLAFNKDLTLESKEEAERIKAMPEYQELQKSFKLYMNLSDTVQSEEIKKMPELLKKIPENLRALYFEQLHNFEQAREKEIHKQGIAIVRLIIGFAVCFGALFVFHRYWDGWNWWGLKGISSAIMLILPVFTFEEGKENEPLAGMYWFVAFLSFMLPSWEKSSWVGWKTMIVIVGALVLRLGVVLVGRFNQFTKARKRAITYMKDFEYLTSQCDEYRNFKHSAVKNETDN